MAFDISAAVVPAGRLEVSLNLTKTFDASPLPASIRSVASVPWLSFFLIVTVASSVSVPCWAKEVWGASTTSAIETIISHRKRNDFDSSSAIWKDMPLTLHLSPVSIASGAGPANISQKILRQD